MRQKKTVEIMTAEDAESYATSLGCTVEDLKSTTVSLYDIVTVRHDPEVLKAFSSARSVFLATNFYTVKALLERTKRCL